MMNTREPLVSVRPTDLPARRGREETRRGLNALRLILPTDVQEEQFALDNRRILTPGEFGSLPMAKPGTWVRGFPGTLSTGILDIPVASTRGIIEGVHFYSATANWLARVSASSNMVFMGCVFEKGPNAPMSAVPADELCYVNVLNGGKAVFVGCTFQGTPAAGIVVLNAAAAPAGNAQIVGCSNRTGQAHSNVTVVGEI